MDGPASRALLTPIAGRVVAGYALLAALAVAVALALRDGVPWLYPQPWLALSPAVGLCASAGLGLLAGALVVAVTRVCVARFAWAQRLHLDLRPIAHGVGACEVALIAAFSSLGEELLFRGLLQPWLGLWPAAVLFGILHQLPGPARWVWVTWATAAGLLFGAVFAATGSLVGPILAHALINGANLVFLRDHDPLAPRPGLSARP